jgi:hypothetical protein
LQLSSSCFDRGTDVHPSANALQLRRRRSD